MKIRWHITSEPPGQWTSMHLQSDRWTPPENVLLWLIDLSKVPWFRKAFVVWCIRRISNSCTGEIDKKKARKIPFIRFSWDRCASCSSDAADGDMEPKLLGWAEADSVKVVNWAVNNVLVLKCAILYGYILLKTNKASLYWYLQIR